MDLLTGIVEGFQRGGLVMWPIALFSLYGFALVAERWLLFRAQNNLLSTASDSLSGITGLGQVKTNNQADSWSAADDIFDVVLGSRDLERSERQEKARNVFADSQARLEARLNTISVIATLLPMLGLLGTVVGMIAAFDVIALHGTGNPNLMAEGISQALITTEAGLLTSIPLFYFHNVLSGTADELVRRLDDYTITLLHLDTDS